MMSPFQPEHDVSKDGDVWDNTVYFEINRYLWIFEMILGVIGGGCWLIDKLLG